MELSGQFPVKYLCEVLSVNRSGFYKWKKRLENPSSRMKSFISDLVLFKEYHAKYPSHGYRWLNAKILLDTGLIMSDQRAHRICKAAGIVSVSKHYRYKKPGDPYKVYPNLLMTGLNVSGPLQCIVSDMTAFYLQGVYYELTLFMDIWNNEILSYSLSKKRGDRMTYMNGLKGILDIKAQYPNMEMILHTDQGSVYSSKSFNELLPLYNIVHSMSRAGTPTDNAAMEAINGWIKAEMFKDLHVTSNENIAKEIADYIVFFNEKRKRLINDTLYSDIYSIIMTSPYHNIKKVPYESVVARYFYIFRKFFRPREQRIKIFICQCFPRHFFQKIFYIFKGNQSVIHC